MNHMHCITVHTAYGGTLYTLHMGYTAYGGTLYTLHVGVHCTHCIWGYTVRPAYGGTLYTLHMGVHCTHCIWRYTVHTAYGGTLYILYMKALRYMKDLNYNIYTLHTMYLHTVHTYVHIHTGFNYPLHGDVYDMSQTILLSTTTNSLLLLFVSRELDVLFICTQMYFRYLVHSVHSSICCLAPSDSRTPRL